MPGTTTKLFHVVVSSRVTLEILFLTLGLTVIEINIKKVQKQDLKSIKNVFRGIKDWVQGFWGYIMAKFESVSRQIKPKLLTVVTCSPTLVVYSDIILGHTHKQLSCTKPLLQSISVQ